MAGDTAEELERFRRQWQEEVTARSKGAPSKSSTKNARPEHSNAGGGPSRAPPAPRIAHKEPPGANDDWEYGYHDLDGKDEVRKLGESGTRVHPSTRREPISALEHYERGVERETEGNLGDSLGHYRKAYKLDAGVDRIYKNKHFPPTSSTATQELTSLNPSKAPVTVTNTANHSLADANTPISQLIASFAALSIPGVEGPTDASPQPLCPIANVPSEILTQILLQTAIFDPASFAGLSLVCKRLAYLVATEDRIWRRVCMGSDHGFAAMHYIWACSMTGNPLPMSLNDLDTQFSSLSVSHAPLKLALTPVHYSYRTMYHTRPRIRFTGCYISTVNYIRPGAATASQATWNSPVLVVTYYRYLRFFRDGTCVSLLTTAEPADVVHHLTKENLGIKNHSGGLPSAVMNEARRGRWRLSGDPYGVKKVEPRILVQNGDEDEGREQQVEAAGEEEEEGIVHIETEGSDARSTNPKYLYKMMLKLESAGARKAGKVRNNKMAWLGYWSYNKLSDDWAEFGLKNDKPFFWSRIRSYGVD